jgi:hypothetical protein
MSIKESTLQEISDIGQEIEGKWQGLTDEEIKKAFEADWNNPECPDWVIDFSKRIEAKLRERNT